ncbi:MAG: alpha/beta hydrolase [Bacteroidia bacterium]|nr:alpha/beta hydrolase [Bacteroidia bacterium]
MNYIQTSNDFTGKPVKINYNDYGTGEPVILISGWPLSKEMWEYQIDDLVNSGHRVIAYDRRGFGKSSQPWDGYDYDTLTDDLKALIDQLKLEDITLVGFSMGGGEVVRYFSRHGGKNVSRVVLISAVTPYMLKTDTNPDGVPKEMFDAMADQMTQDRINFLDDFGKTFFGASPLNKTLSAPLLEYYRMLCSVASPRATASCAKAFATTDFRSEMQSINVPTLIIHGGEDKTVPIEATAKQSAKVIPDNEFIIYEGAPHGLFYTDRKRLNADLIRFLSTQDILEYQDQQNVNTVG